MNRMVFAFAALVLGSAASSGAPQELMRCVAGQQVIDKEGKTGVIVADDSKLCQVKYARWSDLPLDILESSSYSGLLPNPGW